MSLLQENPVRVKQIGRPRLFLTRSVLSQVMPLHLWLVCGSCRGSPNQSSELTEATRTGAILYPSPGRQIDRNIPRPKAYFLLATGFLASHDVPLVFWQVIGGFK